MRTASVAVLRPCYWCGREQTENPAHDQADPDTGYGYECIPCLVRQRNLAQRALRKIEDSIATYRDERNSVVPNDCTCGYDGCVACIETGHSKDCPIAAERDHSS